MLEVLVKKILRCIFDAKRIGVELHSSKFEISAVDYGRLSPSCISIFVAALAN